MPEITILRAEPRDAEALSRVTMASKAHWGYPTDWLEKWAGDLQLTPNYIEEHLVYKAVIAELKAGYYSLIPWDNLAWLDNLFIHPNFMGRGVGRALFEHSLTQCRVLGKTRMQWESDPNASDFYDHMGAHRIGEKAADYGRTLPIYSIEVPPLP
jgi:GNAT superfamily N-acetyltransferase